MIIAQEKRKTNIIEYILYMWNVEDILRSLNLEMSEIEKKIVSQYEVDESKRAEIKKWYEELVTEMKSRKLQEKGHLSELNELLVEINLLHESLLNLYNDNQYKGLFEKAENNLKALAERSQQKDLSTVEAGLTGLYGIMMLRLKKKDISTETEESIKTIADLFALLSLRYREMKAGKLHMNFERKN